MFMSESLPAFRRRWKSEIDFRLFCYKEHSQTGKGVRTGGGTSAPDMQWEGRSGSKRGCLERTREKLFEGPFQKGAKLLSVTTAQCDGRVVRERRWPVGDLLHRIAATDKQEVRVVLIVGTSCPKAGLPRNRATRCGADRSVSEGYGEEGWSHRG